MANTGWTITANPEIQDYWINRVTGEAHFPENTTPNVITYTITYTPEQGGSKSCERIVKQKGNPCSFTYTVNTAKIPLEGGDYEFGTLSNLGSQTITVKLTDGTSQYVNGNLTVSNGKVVGNVKSNDSGAETIPSRDIKYSLYVGDVQCGEGYKNTQDGKVCTCECTELSVSPTSLSWAYNDRTLKKITITPGCTKSITVDKTSSTSWFTVSDIVNNVITVTPSGENQGEEPKSGNIKIKFKACGNDCTAEYKTIPFTQGFNACDCNSVVFTKTNYFVSTATTVTLGTYTMNNNCDWNKVSAIKVKDDCNPYDTPSSDGIDWSSVGVTTVSGGYALTARTNVPQGPPTCEIKYNVTYDGIPCGEYTITRGLNCNCDDIQFWFYNNNNRFPLSNEDDEEEWDLDIGTISPLPSGDPDCIDSGIVEFFSSDTEIVPKVWIDNESWPVGPVHATMKKVDKPCKCYVDCKVKKIDGSYLQCGRYEIKRVCYCPTDNCVVYGLNNDPVYYHPMHVDYTYVGPSGARYASPHEGDTLLLGTTGKIVYKPDLANGRGDVYRKTATEDRIYACYPTDGCVPGGTSQVTAYEKYVITVGDDHKVTAPSSGVTLQNGDTFIITGGKYSDGTSAADFEVLVTYTEFEGYGTTCKRLDYYASKNSASKWREIIFPLKTVDSTDTTKTVYLDCTCVDEGDTSGDFRQGKPSCDDFLVSVRQSSTGKRFVRTCVNYYTMDSGYEEVNWDSSIKGCSLTGPDNVCPQCEDGMEWE